MWVHPDNSWLHIPLEQITLKKHSVSRIQEKEVVGMNLALLLQLSYNGSLISCRKFREKPCDSALDMLTLIRKGKSSSTWDRNSIRC